MKLWAELTMSLHQLDTASITEGGFGRKVMALSCQRDRNRSNQKSLAYLSVYANVSVVVISSGDW